MCLYWCRQLMIEICVLGEMSGAELISQIVKLKHPLRPITCVHYICPLHDMCPLHYIVHYMCPIHVPHTRAPYMCQRILRDALVSQAS